MSNVKASTKSSAKKFSEAEKTRSQRLELQLFGSLAKDLEETSNSGSDSDDTGSEREGPSPKKSKRAPKKVVPSVADEECLWEDEDDQDQTLSAGFIRENAPDILTAKDLLSGDKLKKHSAKIREQFEERSHLGLKPEWAKKFEESRKNDDENSDSDSDDEALESLNALARTAGKHIGRPAFLPRTYLQATKLPDPTLAHHKRGKKVKVVRFHPTEPVFLTGNTSGGVKVYRVAQSVDDLQRVRGDAFLQEVNFKKYNIEAMDFCDETNVFISSNRSPTFYEYDLMSGHITEHRYPDSKCDHSYLKILSDMHREQYTGLRSRLSADGTYVAFLGQGAELYVFARVSMTHLHTFVASKRIVDAAFSPTDSSVIYALSASGECYIWNMKAKGTQHIFQDDGCVHSTVLSVSQNNQFLACGQNTGIVNVYDTGKCKAEEAPRPLHTFTNLTTSVSFVEFNHDAQMMTFGSEDKPMSYRVSHNRSGTVFKGFPPKNETLSKNFVSCASFSPHSAFAVYGTTEGAVRLYRLPHFTKY